MSGYQNPVVSGFHPDPSVCRVDDEYFLVTSSFTYFPGVPIFRSTDLVHWTQLGNVLDRPSQLDLTATSGWSSFGVYAPTIRHHDGRFFMVTTNVTVDVGGHSADNFVVTAEDPSGEWSDPIHIGVSAGDPDLAWDDHGRCWMHGTGSAGIVRCRIDDGTGEVLDPPVKTWSGTGMQNPEGPHLLRRDNTWYLLIAEGGTHSGHCVSIARGPSPTGPWESCPHNPIVTHRSTDHPIQSTGHADLVEAVDGSWWMVALGVRPRGFKPGYHVLGREAFLAPVEWADGWPVVGGLDLTVPTLPPGISTHVAPRVRDDFDADILAPHWVSVRSPLPDHASLTEKPGWLTLHGRNDGLDDAQPAFVGRRQQHHQCNVRVLVDPEAAAEAGLAVRMDEQAHYEVFVADGSLHVRARIGPLSQIVASTPSPSPNPVLRIAARNGTMWQPDVVVLGYETNEGRFEELANLDGRYLSTEVAGGFIGRVIGVYAVGGIASFDWFDYEPLVD